MGVFQRLIFSIAFVVVVVDVVLIVVAFHIVCWL